MNTKLIAVLSAILIGGCGNSYQTRERVGNMQIVNVHSSGQDLTIASASITTLACSKNQCKHIATGGGVTNGAAGIIAPVANAAAIIGAPGTSLSLANNVAVKTSSKSTSKSIGPGSSTVKVNSSNVNVNDNNANALNINKN